MKLKKDESIFQFKSLRTNAKAYHIHGVLFCREIVKSGLQVKLTALSSKFDRTIPNRE